MRFKGATRFNSKTLNINQAHIGMRLAVIPKNTQMIRNYLTIAYRNIVRNKAFSFINIFGLAVGLATCLVIMLYIFEEAGYDKFVKDPGQIYRVASKSDKAESWAAQPAPMAGLLQASFPEVNQAARLLTFTDIANMLLKVEENGEKKQFFEPNGYYVDSNFFQVLTFPFITGNPATALVAPNTMVISQTLSAKLFGDEKALGKVVRITTPFGDFDYKVTGVFDDAKAKSHIPASYFLSMRNNDMWNWVKDQDRLVGNSVFYTYLKFKPNSDVPAFTKKMLALYEQRAGAEMKAAGITNRLFLQPLNDIYLKSSMPNEIGPNGNIRYLYILGSIAIFILIIACINFMNLSTARSEKRAREVGVRKVLGAERSSLIRQFLGESMLHACIALAIALFLVYALLPYFNNLAQTEIKIFDSPARTAWIAALTLFTGLLAGLYPALYLSSFRPVKVLKGKIINSFSALAIRKGLVIFQFTISVCLILGALVIWKQLKYLNTQELGFDKHQKIIIPLAQGFLNTETNYTALKNELQKNPEVKSVTCGSSYPGLPNLNDMLFYADGKNSQETVDVQLSVIENNYLQTMDFKILKGRPFSNDYKADSASIILNEAAVKHFGFTMDNAVGKTIRFDLSRFHGALNVVGVVKDFNFESLHKTIKPFGFMTNIFGNPYGYAIASVSAPTMKDALLKIEKSWSHLNPSVPFVYSFLDQDFQRHYDKEQRVSSLLTGFMVIAILIACLGLFGLAAFSAEQRRKEIGIRKVLGASVSQVTMLLSKEFLRLVALSVIIATPIAWWGMNRWLQDFAYKTAVSWWMFALAGLLALITALATVSFQAIKAALNNPVNSLRSE